MAQEVVLDGISYISSKRAAEIFGYTQDYIGQLARLGKITARRVGGLWYVVEESLRSHKHSADLYAPFPPQPQSNQSSSNTRSVVDLDGKSYLSAAQAAKVTKYHADYVTQLARAGKIPSKQVGTRWYVDIHSLRAHKTEKDRLLGAVQAEAVGIRKDPLNAVPREEAPREAFEEPYFNYAHDAAPLFPIFKSAVIPTEMTEVPSTSEKNKIPIRIIRSAASVNLHDDKSALLVKKGVRVSGRAIFYGSFTTLLVIAVTLIAFNVRIAGFQPAVQKIVVVAREKISLRTFGQSEGGLKTVIARLISKEIRYQR